LPVKVNFVRSGVDSHGAFLEVHWAASNASDFEWYRVFVATNPDPDTSAGYGVPYGGPIYNQDVTALYIQDPTIKTGNTYWIRVEVVDKEDLSSLRNTPPTAVTIEVPPWYTDVLLLTLIVVGAAVVVLIGLSYGLARRREAGGGKPFRWRSSKAEAVVDEGKGPKGKPRAPKGERPAAATTAPGAVPAPPSKQSQEAVDYMQRVLRGGR
jgi:hypothetical protein